MAETAQIAREEATRDRGLVRAIGVAGFAAAITNEVVGSGVYRNPPAMAAAAGTAAPFAYLACLVAMGAIVLCFAEAGSRVPTSGGPYSGGGGYAGGRRPDRVEGAVLVTIAEPAEIVALLGVLAGSAIMFLIMQRAL